MPNKDLLLISQLFNCVQRVVTKSIVIKTTHVIFINEIYLIIINLLFIDRKIYHQLLRWILESHK